MSFSDLLRLSSKQLRARKIETMLIVLAIALCVLVLAVILSPLYVSRLPVKDIRDFIVTVNQSASNINNELLNGSGFPLIRYDIPDDPSSHRLTIKEVEEIFQAIPESKFYFSGSRSGSRIRGYNQYLPSSFSQGSNIGYQGGMLSLTPLTPEAIYGLELKLASGSLYTKEDYLNNKPYIILGSDLAKSLFPSENPIGKTVETISVNSPTFTVLGVLEPVSFDSDDKKYSAVNNLLKDINQMAISSYTSVIPPEQGPTYSVVFFYPKTPSLKLQNQIASYLKKHYKGFFNASCPYASYSSAMKNWQKSYLVLGIIATLILLIACINIMNLFFVRIAKQNRSIGLNVALGATKKTIFSQYLVTAIIQGLLGGFLGVLIFWCISKTGLRQTFHLVFNIQAILWGIASGIFMSLVFGIYPAVVAASTSPVDALRME